MKDFKFSFSLFLKYATICLGSAIFAAGFQFFLVANNVPCGGLSGIAQILNHYTGLPIGTMTMIFNIPIFILAWRRFGIGLVVGSLVSTVVSNMMIDLFATTSIVITNDTLLACIIGGALKGAGLGLVFYVGATTGGMDIVAKLIKLKYSEFNIGTLVLIIDLVIVGTYALLLKSYESAMYSCISMFVVSKVIDLCVYGFDTSNLCYIISNNSSEITKALIEGINRGVTILEGEGAYSGAKKQVIMCVVKRQQISELKNLIKSIDDRAFVIISDAKNVFGQGFENIHSNK